MTNAYGNVPISTDTSAHGQNEVRYVVIGDYGSLNRELQMLLDDVNRRIRDELLDRDLDRRRREVDQMMADFRAHARRFSKGETSRPPPAETRLRVLPRAYTSPEQRVHETRVSARLLASARGRRPMRGRPGRPHDAASEG